ncbi:cadherin-23-like [Ostrea edulis]|uniref:cadherin-23-like n=1 Tax=Ostrea edulis TaxID=37623 RepID=UPI0024AFB4A7|nr:cadherin-23-like [Ostrea edulis]
MAKLNLTIYVVLVFICNTLASDYPPRISVDSTIQQASESASIGALLFTITADDRNGGTVDIMATGQTSQLVNIRQTTSGHSVTGDVLLKTKLDREVKSSHTMTFIATSSSKDAPASSLEVTLFVTDVNDEKPMFSNQAYRVKVPENHTLSSDINANIYATDSDNGPGGSVSYSIQPAGQASALYDDTFGIREKSGKLYLKKALDYETLTFYQYKVIAKDGGNPQLNNSADLLITILDVQDTPPIFQGLPYMADIMEDSPVGTIIFHRVFALDGDTGTPNNVSYSISGNCQSYIHINPSSGVVSINKTMDRDQGTIKDHHGVCLMNVTATEVTDHPSDTSQTTTSITLLVGDVNDNSPVFNKRVYQGYVQEDMTDIVITIPGDISVSDADQGSNSIIDLTVYNNNGRTRIPGIAASPPTVYSSGTIYLRLVNNFTFDSKVQNKFEFIIIAKDRGSPFHSNSCRVIVHINMTNRFYPQFPSAAFAISVLENTASGTRIALIQAYDMDFGIDGVIRYMLQGDDNVFSIDSITGQLSVACNCSCLDRERQSVYHMTLEALDGGEKMSSVPVKVIVLDVNDNSPVFLQPKYEFGITENSSLLSGMDNFTIHAMDDDEPLTPNSLITFAILPRPDALDKHFAINTSTGSIRIVNPLRFDQLSSALAGRLDLAVTAHDHGNPSLTSTVSVIAFFQSPAACNCENSISTKSTRPPPHMDSYSGQSFILCQGQEGYIQCDAGKVIRILSAVYGRTSDVICPSHNVGSLTCQSHSSSDHAKWSCNGYGRCRMYADSSVFGEPCTGINKYLEVAFHCVHPSTINCVFG